MFFLCLLKVVIVIYSKNKATYSCMHCNLYSLWGHWCFLVELLSLTATVAIITAQVQCRLERWHKQLILFAMQTSRSLQHHRLDEMKVKFRELWSLYEKSKYGCYAVKGLPSAQRPLERNLSNTGFIEALLVLLWSWDCFSRQFPYCMSHLNLYTINPPLLDHRINATVVH